MAVGLAAPELTGTVPVMPLLPPFLLYALTCTIHALVVSSLIEPEDAGAFTLVTAVTFDSP